MLEYEYKPHKNYGLNANFVAQSNVKNRLRKETEERKKQAELLKQHFENILKQDTINKTDFAFNRGINHKKYHRIEYRICSALRMTPEEIKSESRVPRLVFARQALMYWAVRLTNYSYPQIGERMGNRDHTTILHGAKAYRVKRAKMGRHLREAR